MTPSNSPVVRINRSQPVGFDYKVNFPVNSLSTFTFSVSYPAQVISAATVNMTSYVLKKNGSVVTMPFAVVAGDNVTVDSVIKLDSAQPATITFKDVQAQLSNVSVNALTAVDATRKHLFIICYNSQTVSVFNTQTETEESIITLPTGFNFQCLLYRSADDFIYVFGLNRVCKINANPASPNFKNVYALDNTLNGSSSLGTGTGYPVGSCVYDFVNDVAYLGVYVYSQFGKWNFSATTWTLTYTGALNGSLFYLPPNKIVLCDARVLFTKADVPTSYGLADGGIIVSTCKAAYNSKNNSFYAGRASAIKYNADTGVLAAVIVNSGIAANAEYQAIGNCIYCPDYDILINLTYGTTGSAPNQKFFIINTLTDTCLTATGITRINQEANEIYARSGVYGAFAKKWYHMSNGEGNACFRVHKYNPQLWVNNGKVNGADMIDGYLTTTNSISQPAVAGYGYRGHQAMCFNHLIPF